MVLDQPIVLVLWILLAAMALWVATAWRAAVKEIAKVRAENLELRAKLELNKKDPDYDCRQLLNDLTSGVGLVKITRVSPLDVFIRRNS